MSPFDKSSLSFVRVRSNHGRHLPVEGGANRLVIGILERNRSCAAWVPNYLHQIELFIPLWRKESDGLIETKWRRTSAQKVLGDQPQSLTSLLPTHGPSSVWNSVWARLGVPSSLRFLQKVLWTGRHDVGEVVRARVFVDDCSAVFI